MSAKQDFLEFFEQESARTLRVLRAYPAGQDAFRPHERSSDVRKLAHTFVLEQGLTIRGLTGELNVGGGVASLPAAAPTIAEIADQFEAGVPKVLDTVRGMSDDALNETMPWPVSKGKMGAVPKLRFAWLMLFDQIHHRGQLSVYIRLAGGKVPSIYGPSADDPNF